MPGNNFYEELKRRNVYRVAVTYAIVAWLVLQVVTVISPIIDAPGWVDKAVLMLLIIGFPIALVFAWVYEMSPQGIIRTDSQEAGENSFSDERKKPIISNIIIGILLMVIAGQVVYNQVFRNKNSEDITDNVLLADKSIAVLPLVNLNSKDENLEYFSDGVTNEIIDELAKIKSFVITAFTTSLLYKNTDKSQNEIGQELDVNYLIAGSSRIFSNGDSVKLSIELINPISQKRIWNSNYLVEMKDAPGIQASIARKVAENLNIKLTASEEMALQAENTSSGEAFRLFLQAKSEFARLNGTGFKKSITLLVKALELDPDYAQVHTFLAWTYNQAATTLFQGHFDWPQEKTKDLFKKHADKSIKLQSLSSDIYLVRANYHINHSGLLQEARKDVDYALEINSWPRIPTNYCICTAGTTYLLLGEHEKAKEITQISAKVDPGNIYVDVERGMIKFIEGEMEEAQSFLKNALKTVDIPFFNILLGMIYYHNNQYKKALTAFEKAYNFEGKPLVYSVAYLANTHHKLGNIDKSKKYTEELKNRRISGENHINYSMAAVEMTKGNFDKTLALLESAYDKREASLPYFMNLDPLFRPLYDHPRFIEIRKKMQYYGELAN